MRCAPHSGKPDCLRRGVSKHRVVAVAVLVGCRVAARCPARSPASCVKPLVGLTCRIVHATWPCTAVGSCGGGSRDCQPRVPSACRALPSVPTLVWSRAAATLHQSTCPLFGTFHYRFFIHRFTPSLLLQQDEGTRHAGYCCTVTGRAPAWLESAPPRSDRLPCTRIASSP